MLSSEGLSVCLFSCLPAYLRTWWFLPSLRLRFCALLCEAHKTQTLVRASYVCRDRSGRVRGEGDRGERKTSREQAGLEKNFLESFFGALYREKGFSFFLASGVELQGFFSFAMATVVGTMAMAGSLMRLPQPSLALSSTRAPFPGRLCLCSFRATGRLQLQSSSSWQRRPLFVSQKSAQSEARVFFVLFLLIFVPSCFDKNPED